MKLVINLRMNVKKRVNITEVASGLNVRRIIEKAVFDELCSMLDGSVPPIIACLIRMYVRQSLVLSHWTVVQV